MAEILDMIDEDNNVIGTMTRPEMRKSNLLHRGVVIFVFNSEGKFLIQKRSKDKDYCPGMYDLSCGGSVRSGESFADGAARELKEELSIDAPLIFVSQERYRADDNNFLAHIYCVLYDGEIKLLDGEVDEARFVDKSELAKLIESDDFASDGKYMIEKYYEQAKEVALS